MILSNQNHHVQSLPELLAFWKTVAIRETLTRYCANKHLGVNIFDIFSTLFLLAFRQKNFWRCSISQKDSIPFGKDTAYRFLNSPFHNWRAFLSQIAKRAIAFLSHLTSESKRRVFVVDDSLYNKNRSKKLELLSKVYDHAENRFVRGFRMLTLGFTDGVSFIPLDFALLASKRILCDVNHDIDKRSHGAKRRSEALDGAPNVLLSLVDKHRDLLQVGCHIVFDSWFSFPSLICKLAERALHVTCRLKNNSTHYLFRRGCKNSLVTLKQLYTKLSKIPPSVRQRQRGENADILGSLGVMLPSDGEKQPVAAKIVFLKNKNKDAQKSQDWLAILTTDLELTEEQVVQMYAKRWKIEEFFKTAKSLLQLEREFQGRSYDMLIAHTTLVCTRFIFLELERRRNLDIRTCGELFYRCCDALPDLKLREAIALIFTALEAFLKKFPSEGETFFSTCLAYFTATLPSSLLALFPISRCES